MAHNFCSRIYHVVMSRRLTGFQASPSPLDSEGPEARAFCFILSHQPFGPSVCPVCRRAQSMVTQQINNFQVRHCLRVCSATSFCSYQVTEIRILDTAGVPSILGLTPLQTYLETIPAFRFPTWLPLLHHFCWLFFPDSPPPWNLQGPRAQFSGCELA